MTTFMKENERYLTITMHSDWVAVLQATAQAAKGTTYQGEVLNFESPADFLDQLTKNRWDIMRAVQGKGALSVRELARTLGRDVKRVHKDAVILAGLGLPERAESSGVLCPFSSIHINMYLRAT